MPVIDDINFLVCALSKGQEPNSFLSSSWDNTAKYWNLASSTIKALVTFTGHQAAVWHAKLLSTGQVATASADKTIGIWSPTGQKVNTLKGRLESFYFKKYMIFQIIDLPFGFNPA